ncbi:MAG: protoporphyrinogen oxidase [Nitrospiraceae bacterium]|nr:protoporphyrinogen oxidase [Nitrospiraceae bacterium]
MKAIIAGGGISGLSLAYFLKAGGIDSTVFEAAPRPGGKIRTEKAQGFLCEWGVNGFLDNKPRTLELAGRLSLKALRSSDAARKRFVLRGGKLRKIPEGPGEFISSGVLSPLGKLRLVLEPFIKPNLSDETLADFARRRLGKDAFENLIDPMASGVYAGDPEKMSVESCFPRIKAIEKKHGSLIKGMIAMGKEAKKTGKAKVGPGPGGALTSFSGGMEEIIKMLRLALDDKVTVNSRAVSIEKTQGGYRLLLEEGAPAEAETLVLACPAYESAEILRGIDERLSVLLSAIAYPPVSVICLGFSRQKINFPVDSFGFLVPFRERKSVLGVLFDSSIFPERAPEGQVLLRIMAGGARMGKVAMLDDEKLLDTVMADLGVILGIKATPDMVRIFRHEKAIPQYEPGHTERLREIDSIMAGHHGLYLAGNAYRGIALNDCIENSALLAEKIIKESK